MAVGTVVVAAPTVARVIVPGVIVPGVIVVLVLRRVVHGSGCYTPSGYHAPGERRIGRGTDRV